MKHLTSICLLLISILWISCTDHIVYHSYHHFPKKGWDKSDTLLLDIQVVDSAVARADIIFLVRNKTNYPYQDFNVTIRHNIPDSLHWRDSELRFVMADKEGKWNGDGWGGLYQSSARLENIEVPPGIYTFKVVHQMADERLEGINDVGILIKKEKIDR